MLCVGLLVFCWMLNRPILTVPVPVRRPPGIARQFPPPFRRGYMAINSDGGGRCDYCGVFLKDFECTLGLGYWAKLCSLHIDVDSDTEWPFEAAHYDTYGACNALSDRSLLAYAPASLPPRTRAQCTQRAQLLEKCKRKRALQCDKIYRMDGQLVKRAPSNGAWIAHDGSY
jgi:hypothetical protein